jgi:hypothetical protein
MVFGYDGTMSTSVVYRCPTTGLKIQVLLDDVDEDEDSYEAIPCPSCKGIHLVRPKTGDVLISKSE